MSKFKQEMMSLYDYLGRAAGNQLGEQVAAYATLRKTKHAMRYVSTKTYQGYVMLYTKEFLDEYFKAKDVFTDKTDYTSINTQLMNDSYENYNNDNLIF
jgi:hypothetical protein